MEKLKIKSELISLEEQLEILERAKTDYYPGGLCRAIGLAIAIRPIIPLPHSYTIKSHIPLFTRENAKKYGKSYAKGTYWWRHNPYNFKSRVKFLDWMINEIKKEIENEKTKN